MPSLIVLIRPALSRHPTVDIMVVGDFNVHHKEWLVHSHSTDASGVSAFNFAMSHDLTQIISAPTNSGWSS